MIECKTWGQEFEKAFKKLEKDGGQLFTYFQQDRDTEYLVLYASDYENNEIKYINEIIKIEDSYRETSNVKDFFDRWSKLSSQNGLFDDWVNAYDFKSKALTLNQLKNITQKDSSFIFNRFLEILRHNVVSDKPNAFNKIFTLFLCKIVDENRNPDDQLDFQWIEGVDDNISFQKRLTDLYKKGMRELLSKEVTDISDDEFNKKYGSLDDAIRENILKEITRIRLQKNNEFAIKEVFDEETFEENAKVLKEVVELLQIYRIRYAEKQQYLSDFFELLLTTGLKQESGQFFTPVPIARFICRSIPLDKITEEKLILGDPNDLLPTSIDYATGSGHFLTESMNEIQNIIQSIDESKLKPQVRNEVASWKIKPFNWAYDYVYGIEKDYRLVKTAKVGCYLHGDGVAQVIHSDGLGSFLNTKEYKNKLKYTDSNFTQDNKKFDIVISNPPYSVSAFKANLKRELAEKDFELYKNLTDQSSEIECLFVERTKQLLKDGGVAGIILPLSILSNGGVYTKTREIILKYFDIIAITELGSNTFMATGTNTVILFLRRKNNYDWENINNSVNNFFINFKDVSVNNIQNIFSKYLKHVWKNISLTDYISLLKKTPNKNIVNHEIYKEYSKIKSNKNDKLENRILEIEKDKLLYFILAYNQKIVLVKSGKKDIEKDFLGYEFSNRRGCEGIHSIKKNLSIDECTKLFDSGVSNNSLKASTYIYDAFENKFDRSISDELRKHVSRIDLINMISWDRSSFEKSIDLNIQEKIDFEKIWKTNKLVCLIEIAKIEKGTSITKEKVKNGNIPVVAGGQEPAYYHNKANRDKNIITVSASGAYSGFVNYFNEPIFASDSNTIKSNNENKISTKLIYYLLKNIQEDIYRLQRGQAQPHVYGKDLEKIKIPFLQKNVQEKIIKEIGILEKKEAKDKENIKYFKNIILINFDKLDAKANKILRLSDDNIFDISIGRRIILQDINKNKIGIPVYSANVFEPFGFIDKKLISNFDKPSILWGIDGDWMVNYIDKNKEFYPTDHCGVMRVDEKEVNLKYLKWLLKKAGDKVNFSRNYRASIDRIKSLSVAVPPIALQDKIIKEIDKAEIEIAKLNNEIKNIPRLKDKILNKYL